MHGRRVGIEDGSGGPETERLVRRLYGKYLNRNGRNGNIIGLEAMDDSSYIRVGNGYIVVTVDSYTVDPLFFPGGDLGKLAVTGTLNDLAVSGARPLGLMDSLILEEGVELDLVERIAGSLVKEAEENNVDIIGGDLKVMPKGQVDRIVVSMTGIGYAEKPILDRELKPGDKIIVSGSLGDHGALIAALRYGLEVGESLRSDCSSILRYMQRILEEHRWGVHAARDPTRGGLSMVLNDWSSLSGLQIIVDEDSIPVKPQVRAVAEILGINPLALASEGRFVLGVDPREAEQIVEILRDMGLRDTSIIGEVRKGEPIVLLRTRIGGTRLLEPPANMDVPRIC